MKKNEIMAVVCNAINLNTDMIEKLSSKFEVEVTNEAVGKILDYCRSKGDLSEFSTMLVRFIYTTVLERYEADLGLKKFVWKSEGDEPYIEYDGQRIVSNMQLRAMVREKKEITQWEAQKNAPREFHLTDEDKKILLDWGEEEKNFDQIELEANVCEYTQCFKSKPDRKITRDEAIKILGRYEWLSGIHRTAFHWDCGRTRGDRYVHFESGLVGRGVNEYVY